MLNKPPHPLRWETCAPLALRHGKARRAKNGNCPNVDLVLCFAGDWDLATKHGRREGKRTQARCPKTKHVFFWAEFRDFWRSLMWIGRREAFVITVARIPWMKLWKCRGLKWYSDSGDIYWLFIRVKTSGYVIYECLFVHCNMLLDPESLRCLRNEREIWLKNDRRICFEGKISFTIRKPISDQLHNWLAGCRKIRGR